MQLRNSRSYSLFVLAGLASGLVAVQAQPVALTIEAENWVLYRGNVFDATRLARDAGPTTSVNQACIYSVSIGDIRSVNGKPAKGLWTYTVYALPFRTAPAPGQPIADMDSTGTYNCIWHISLDDGTYIGSLNDIGDNISTSRGHAIAGGMGAFQGVSGEHRTEILAPAREASTSEDPANRRNLGGGRVRAVFYLYPKSPPQVQTPVAGPSVFHEDLSPVTAQNPARRGELLIVRATGLGPVGKAFEPPGMRPFSANPLDVVSTPVVVLVNGTETASINQIGWPGETDVYRVDFRVPADAPAGATTLQLRQAWIPGRAVTIPLK